MKIYLVRHAQAEWWKADENRPLTKEGFEDANRLATLMENYSIQAIYSSPYKRAWQTIEPLAKRSGLEISMENDLRERKLGNIPPDSFLESIQKTWQDPNFAHPDGETNASAQKRSIRVIHNLQPKHENDNIVLASHGNIIALILQAFDPSIDYEFWKSLSMPDIHVLTFSKETKVAIKRLGVNHVR